MLLVYLKQVHIIWGDFMICTFIGHRDAPKEIKPTLKKVLVDLIENKNVNMFYVGNNGSFDFMVKDVLKELHQIYPIKYYIVLAYIPKKTNTPTIPIQFILMK